MCECVEPVHPVVQGTRRAGVHRTTGKMALSPRPAWRGRVPVCVMSAPFARYVSLGCTVTHRPRLTCHRPWGTILSPKMGTPGTTTIHFQTVRTAKYIIRPTQCRLEIVVPAHCSQVCGCVGGRTRRDEEGGGGGGRWRALDGVGGTAVEASCDTPLSRRTTRCCLERESGACSHPRPYAVARARNVRR